MQSSITRDPHLIFTQGSLSLHNQIWEKLRIAAAKYHLKRKEMSLIRYALQVVKSKVFLILR